jgi:hypothetical protein
MKLFRDMGYEVEVACSNVGFTDKIEKEGFNVYNIPFSRNSISLSSIRAFFTLLKLIKERKYIMVHTHTPVASFLGRIAAKIVGVPHIVYTAHGFHFHEYGSKLRNFVYYRLEKFAGKFIDVLITIKKDNYKIAKDKNIVPKGKVVYIKGVGVDLKRFNPRVFDRGNKKNLLKNITAGKIFLITIIVGFSMIELYQKFINITLGKAYPDEKIEASLK